MNMNCKGKVSIIMLSHNKIQYVEESVRSVLAQTYTNWELFFVDDSPRNDDIIHLMMKLKKGGMCKKAGGAIVDRINVLQTVYKQGDTNIINSTLKNINSDWVAFLNAGDIWAPEKLERQMSFMEEHGYSFSYTLYRLMDAESKDRGFVIGGKDHVNHMDMLKCCWAAYLTVMYDASKVGKIQVHAPCTNYYALWLRVSEKYDCHLLPENLAMLRTKWNKLGKILLTNNFKWRYDAYRVEEDLGRIKSLCYTIRNMWFGLVKWHKYVKRSNGNVL